MASDRDVVSTLSSVTTATLTTLLLKKGLRNVWMRGTRPIRSGQPRKVGRVFTLRFVPAREDLATPESWASPISTRAAISLIRASQARAMLAGRDYVIPEDIQAMAQPVLAHRIVLSPEARLPSITPERAFTAGVGSVPVPVKHK